MSHDKGGTMTDAEIRNAVEYLENMADSCSLSGKGINSIWLLIDLATRYLELGGVIEEIPKLPKDMFEKYCNRTTGQKTAYDYGFIEGKRVGRQDTLLATTHELAELKKYVSDLANDNIALRKQIVDDRDKLSKRLEVDKLAKVLFDIDQLTYDHKMDWDSFGTHSEIREAYIYKATAIRESIRSGR